MIKRASPPILSSRLFWRILTKTTTSFAAPSYRSFRKDPEEISAAESQKDVFPLVSLSYLV
jgi:hypothetical protein